MRLRLLVAGALAAGLAAVAPAGALASPNPQQAGLQVALRAQGLYRGPIDAIAGAQTAAAVRAFQRKQGLPVTGVADARTRAALGPLGRPLFGSRALRRGDFGWDVAVLQYLLATRGISVPVNGYFDAPTRHAVRVFQHEQKLGTDGVAGQRTLAALGAALPLAAAAVSTPTSKPKPKPAKLVRHVVASGESLSLLAGRFSTTVAALAKLNALDPAKPLLIGTVLRIPAPPKPKASTTPAVPAPVPVSATVTGVAAVRASIDRWSAHFGVDPHLARALAWMESGYNNDLVSSVGAQGIMQLLPSTWDYVETVLLGTTVPHTADGNVEVGIAYLHHLLADAGGDRRLALAAWYQGEQSVRTDGVLHETEIFVANVLALSERM